MRVLQVVHDVLPFALGGVEVYVDRLGRAQVAAGAEVEVVAAVEEGGVSSYRRGLIGGPVPTHTIASRFGREPFRFARLARDPSLFYRCPEVDAVVERIVRERQPDVAHIHHLVHLSGSLIESIRALGIPVVVTLHDYWMLCISGQLVNDRGPHLPDRCDAGCLRYVLGNRFKSPGALRGLLSFGVRLASAPFDALLRKRRAYLLRQLALADRILVPSRFLGDVFAEAGLSRDRLAVSPYGIPEELLVRGDDAPTRRLSPGTLRLGFLGRIVPEKGLHVLVDAMNGLDPRTELSVYGTGPADYEAEVRRRARHPGIRFHGTVPEGRVGEVLSRLDALVVPSVWWENQPIVILEAFARGVPVIASRLGGMAELVEEGRNGLLFDAGDADALRAALGRLAAEEGLRARLREDPPKVKTIGENARELLELYRTLTAGR